ncbi:MAG: WYL domain-containing protein [Lachnospiraceae bacterium]|nr:WYL domain-containing protein [Lachnospiraceae bacterium]
MELFSEIYSCYYQVLRHILQNRSALTLQDIRTQICGEGFGESLLSIIPKLEDGAWNLLEKDKNLYRSKISSSFTAPISDLERSYLKALLSDPRIGLFLDSARIDYLNEALASVQPLWKPEQFYYFDRFSDGDPYEDENYRSCFRTLLQAQKQMRYVDIDYTSPKGTRLHHHYIPARLEYSEKNDKFRVLALRPASSSSAPRSRGGFRLEILNVSRIRSVRLLDKVLSSPVDLNAMIRRSYYREPLKLRIVNHRNALERAMLHFANYEKNTTKIDEDTYECLIYYNQGMETELLIEVMSFDPMLTVVGNDRFLTLLRDRLRRQRRHIP